MSNGWVEHSSTSNLLKKTYIKDFLDVSGEMYIRNGSMNISGNITATGDLTCKNLSLASGALDSGVNSDVQTALDGKQATVTAGSNITINGSTITSSASGGIAGITEDSSPYTDWEIKGSPIYGTVTEDRAGRCVSMSGDGTRVLLSYSGGSSDMMAFNSSVRVYEYTNNSWSQMGSDIPTFLRYTHSPGGSVISNDGSTIALCTTYGEDSMIRVFNWNGSSWVQRGANLYGNHTGTSNFGVDAALNHDGTVLAAGESKTRDAWWYKWNGSSWVLRVVIPDSGTSTSNLRENGLSLDASGNRLAFATHAYTNSLGGNVGHARVFDWDENTSTSTQVGSDIEGDSKNDYLQSVSITGDGSTIVVGSVFDDTGQEGNTNEAWTNEGSIKVYKYINNSWVKQGSTLYGYQANQRMGWSVDINEEGTIIASASWNSDNSRSHVWKWDGSDWQTYGSSILAEDGARTDTAPTVSLSNDGNTIAIGEWKQDTNTETSSYSVDRGRVRVFKRESYDRTLFDRNTNIEGDLNVTGNVIIGGSTVHTSDDRLKINEVVIEKGLEFINKLTPQIYDKKKSFDDNTILEKDSGLIAQDIWYKTPELRHLVKTPESWKIQHMELGDTINPDPSYNDYGWSNKTPAAVNYIGIIAYLVKSIRELNNKYIENKELIENYKASKNA